MTTPSTGTQTGTDYLATLPYDVLTEMVSRMGISTILKLERDTAWYGSNDTSSDNKYSDINDASGMRKSHLRYLNVNFGNGASLLEAMSRCYVYLSGSRSLEFFEQGNVDDNSDWDFYVPNCPKDIQAFMKSLEDIGVTWMTPRDELSTYLERRNGILHIDRLKLVHLMNAGVMTEIVEHHNLSGPSSTINPCPRYTVSVRESQVHVEPDERSSGYAADTATAIIRGTLDRKGKKIPIQLIAEERGSTKAAIIAPFSYHSSCVQSFIGPYTACHMYGALTSEGNSYGWRDNISDESRAALGLYRPTGEVNVSQVPGWKKYSSRGFKYVNAHEFFLGLTTRTARDQDSIFLEYPADEAVPSDVVSLYKSVSGATTWFQSATGTIAARIPFRGMYGHDTLDMKSWFSRDTDENVIEYVNTFFPHLHCTSADFM